MDITVVICTYNGASRLSCVFDRLASQVLQISVTWDILVVDNNSSDRTAQVIQQYQAQPAFAGRLRHAFEPEQGLAFARRRAVQAASGELLAFLDDDTLPNPCWVQAVYDFGQQHPEAGAYGSQIVGRYAVEPPAGFERIACFLSVIDRGDRAFRYDQLDRWLFPAGAGLVVRRQAWAAVPDRPALSGVSALELTSKGEDIETLSYLRKAGWPIWHNPEMQIEHVIGRDRMTSRYLLALFRGVGLSRHHTRMIRFRPWLRPFAVIAYSLNDLCRWEFHALKHCREKPSVVVQCERTLLYYSWLSPFYVLCQTVMRLAAHRFLIYCRAVQVDSS